jgi:hypothetical protein
MWMFAPAILRKAVCAPSAIQASATHDRPGLYGMGKVGRGAAYGARLSAHG